MKYFGVPRCPYCRKRVNLIRTWSIKRQGEYQCPRCGGISNIYLSPLIYVFALLAVFSGGALYFFHKFVLDDVDLSTIWQVAIPFLCFFLISLFMVYLEKPVIKKVPKTEKGRRRAARETSSNAYSAPRNYEKGMFYEEDEYLPRGNYRTGPISQETLPKPAPKNDLSKTSVVDVARPLRAASEPVPAKLGAVKTEPSGQQPTRTASQSTRTVKKTEVPTAAVTGGDDFWAKYDDPEYVDRRLRELKEKDGKQ